MIRPTTRDVLALATLAAACGGAPSAPAPVHERGDAPADAADAPPAPVSALDALFRGLEPATADAPTPFEAVQACADPTDPDACRLASAAAFDPGAGLWLVLDVDRGEAGPEAIALIHAAPGDERVLLAGDVGPRLGNLRRAMQRYRAALAAPDLIAQRATAEYSISEYAPLVGLAAPLDGWALHLETTSLEERQYRLHLITRGRRRTIELARREATVGACDGDGWTCEADETGERCAEEDLRAEGRLCVQPVGIDRVALAPDGGSLLVLGTVQVAGHGGAPPFHWVVPIPDELRRSLPTAAAPEP